MYNNLSLEYKIKYAELKLASAQKSFDFWQNKEDEVRFQYGKCPLDFQRKHIHDIKNFKKIAKSDIQFWETEINKLNQKQLVYVIFS